jgi:hypothetical protein
MRPAEDGVKKSPRNVVMTLSRGVRNSVRDWTESLVIVVSLISINMKLTKLVCSGRSPAILVEYVRIPSWVISNKYCEPWETGVRGLKSNLF